MDCIALAAKICKQVCCCSTEGQDDPACSVHTSVLDNQCISTYIQLSFGIKFLVRIVLTRPKRHSSAMPHMSLKEIAMLEQMQKRKSRADEILERLQKMRRENGTIGPSQSAVYRAMGGDSQVSVRSQSGLSQVYSQVSVRSCKNQ